MKFNILLILIFLSPLFSFAQKDPMLAEFLNKFPTLTIPVTIEYSHDEFDYGYYSDENLGDGNDSSVIIIAISGQEYQNSVLIKDDSLVISNELMQQYLMADTESVTLIQRVDGVATDTIIPIYYMTSNLEIGKSFYCIVYERQFWIGSGSNAEKYLCTLNKKGKLIDKILVASANYSGTGIMGDSFRIPWFPNVRSVIHKDLTIHFIDANRGYINYKIEKNGKIVKTDEEK